jgi:hypothetical protein
MLARPRTMPGGWGGCVEFVDGALEGNRSVVERGHTDGFLMSSTPMFARFFSPPETPRTLPQREEKDYTRNHTPKGAR